MEMNLAQLYHAIAGFVQANARMPAFVRGPDNQLYEIEQARPESNEKYPAALVIKCGRIAPTKDQRAEPPQPSEEIVHRDQPEKTEEDIPPVEG